MTRREWLKSGGQLLAGLCLPALVRAGTPPVVEIRLHSTRSGGRVWFDPAGVLVAPGTTLRWINQANVHTTTAYHPDNGHRPLRIPETVRPWDSGYLVNPGDAFETTLTEPGVYDYFCAPHEAAGMVGRIIVGHPAGPGARPFDYYRDDPSKRHWKPVSERARAAFPAVETIMKQEVVHAA